jgi:hypothetical protein
MEGRKTSMSSIRYDGDDDDNLLSTLCKNLS